MQLKEIIDRGDIDSLVDLLNKKPSLANSEIVWGEDKKNRTHPLHYICDSVFNGLCPYPAAAALAQQLLAADADVDGLAGTYESALIGATSLSVDSVAEVLIRAGAMQSFTSVFGASALHWAAHNGSAGIVELLVDPDVDIERRCTKFGATPLFWAVHGYSIYGPKVKREQVAAAQCLIKSGAQVNTKNKDGDSILNFAQDAPDDQMFNLLLDFGLKS